MKAQAKAKKPAAPAPAEVRKKIDIRAAIDRELAGAKARRTGRRGGAAPARPLPPPPARREDQDKRGPGRPRTSAPEEGAAPPRRSPARQARAASLAGVKDLATLAALPFPTLTVAEAAGILGCSNMHVSNCLDSGELQAMNIGRPGGERACNRVLKASLEAFIARRGGAITGEGEA